MSSHCGRMGSAIWRVAALGLALTHGVAAWAAQHALLVGVGAYPSLPQQLQLRGPANDVQAMASLLAKSGVPATAIVRLADGLPPAKLPTRHNILGALDGLARQVQPGDQAVVYFAGHGSQQPQARGAEHAEPDGLDEIFLPRDIGRWDGRIAQVTNAITDDEIGAKLAALTDRGTRVWAIFDTCHAGAMLRASSIDETRFRAIAPSQLGMPAMRVRTAKRFAEATPDNPLLVAFFAAAADQRTSEQTLPAGSGAVRGVFSFALEQALLAAPTASFAELFERIRMAYLAEGRINPTPRAEGPPSLMQQAAMDSAALGLPQ